MYQGQYIEISNCQGFSMGYGPITLWASGQSGWFEIQPSAKYEAMYRKMAEGIDLYYFVTELYESLKKKSQFNSKKTLAIDQILLKVRKGSCIKVYLLIFCLVRD